MKDIPSEEPIKEHQRKSLSRTRSPHKDHYPTTNVSSSSSSSLMPIKYETKNDLDGDTNEAMSVRKRFENDKNENFLI
jgi:hypothetical protein